MLKRLDSEIRSGKFNKFSENSDHQALKQMLYDDFNGARENNNSSSYQQNNESTTWTSHHNSY